MNFAGIPDKYSSPEKSKIYLQSIPYDGTSTWGKGADQGFDAFMDAAANMELFDIETNTEVYREGIHVLPVSPKFATPEEMFLHTYKLTQGLLKTKKFLTFFGGEHSISIGIIKAFYEFYEHLTIVQIDAHADLRASYDGSAYNHACALYDASRNTNLIQVGIRSMDLSEKDHMLMRNVFFADTLHKDDSWMAKSLELMTDKVYLTFDLDALDPSIMPATGTPEPGGMQWFQTLDYLKLLFKEKKVVGFDIVELAPIDHLKSPQFLAAKLYYKMLSYKFHFDKTNQYD